MTVTDPAPVTAGVPFFLPARVGQRLCIYHAPHGVALKEAVLYVHPFGDEMHKSRRMAALQTRALACSGIAVLQVDLHGCGDSSGDFADARWTTWRDDLALAHAWLSNASSAPVSLWGLRLGALLALDYARTAPLPIKRFILWQPVLSGRAFITQFLRLRLASEMIEGGRAAAEAKGGTQGLREVMRLGHGLEVAGYDLASALAAEIDAVDANALAPTQGQSVEWFEVTPTADRPVQAASARIIASWSDGGVPVQTHCVIGSAFWNSQEIVECMSLLAATTQAMCPPLA